MAGEAVGLEEAPMCSIGQDTCPGWSISFLLMYLFQMNLIPIVKLLSSLAVYGVN